MKKIVFLLLIIGLTFLNAMSKHPNKDMVTVVDDWEYNSTILSKDTSRQMPTMMGAVKKNYQMSTMSAPKAVLRSKNIGLSVGGAKDVNNFIENIERGYLPKLSSITYEGQFYNHYFDTGLKGKRCDSLFCPSYSSAKRQNNFSDAKEYFLSVGLNSGIDEKDFKRKKLNLVVVLDISGSMGATFDSYHYDRTGNKITTEEKSSKTKMKIASESIVAMLSHLKDDDRVGIALFDHNSYSAKPLSLVGKTDKEAIRNHILALTQRGGTNWSAGYKEGLKLFDEVDLKNNAYENRIVFLTDAMPNRGELSKEKLFGLAKNASKKSIHTTFIGIGVDFNSDLVEYVSKTKGANYFSVHSSKEFSKLLDKEFEYMVNPLVYDLELKLSSSNYMIDAVYGTPEADLSTGQVMKINTLFPSPNNGQATKGGIVLLRLKKIGSGKDDINLDVRYKDVDGKEFVNNQKVSFLGKPAYYENLGIKKAILVSDYVSLMKNWLIDTRAGCNDNTKWVMQTPTAIMKRSMDYPPKHPLYPVVSTWEKRSCKLKVSAGYKKLFQLFRKHYVSEMKALNDDSLNGELKVLDLLLKQKTSTTKKIDKRDDWKFKE